MPSLHGYRSITHGKSFSKHQANDLNFNISLPNHLLSYHVLPFLPLVCDASLT